MEDDGKTRWEMTQAEGVLWEALKDRCLGGLRFRHQHPLRQFILDFYCPSRKLVVEADGAVHDSQQGQDAARARHLEAYGLSVIRFRNDEVLRDLPGVLNRISEAAQARTTELPFSDSPRIGG